MTATVDDPTAATSSEQHSEHSKTSTPLLGSTTPRLWTRPLVEGPAGPCGCGCALTPATSYGFRVERFAVDVLGMPLDPWERFAVIHGCELLPNGRPRFRKLLIIVARQNGKTHLLVVLALYWLFVAKVALVLGTSTNLGYAKESWEKAVQHAEGSAALGDMIARVRRAAGEEALVTVYSTRYRIAAANRKGGRSLTVNRLILDELREHHDWSAWNAAYNAMNAVSDGQAWAITNQGDHRAVVLSSLRGEVVDKDGRMRPAAEVDPELGLFEWSAPPNSRADDPRALAQSNPNLGRRIRLESLLADARRAIRNGGEELTEFLTEILCMKVPNLDPAVSAEGWADGLEPGTMDELRGRMAWMFDVSLDGKHVTLTAAAIQPDERVRVEPVAAWGSVAEFRRDFPALVRRNRPRAVGWFPDGPAAAVAATLAEAEGWPPSGVTFQEIRAETPAVCMGFAEVVEARQVVHSGDPLQDAQIAATEKQQRGDRWVFMRRGAGHCDATYAAAGAVHLARTMPAPPEELDEVGVH